MTILYLRCLIKEVTGYDCPFCGAQRAINALFHGEFQDVWHYNPFLVVMSPYLVMIFLCIFGIIPKGSRLQSFLYDKRTIIVAGILTIGWWIYRNS